MSPLASSLISYLFGVLLSPFLRCLCSHFNPLLNSFGYYDRHHAGYASSITTLPHSPLTDNIIFNNKQWN
ncbi:hypothetical protein LguiA_005429 [Lonicera macranthoides]